MGNLKESITNCQLLIEPRNKVHYYLTFLRCFLLFGDLGLRGDTGFA